MGESKFFANLQNNSDFLAKLVECKNYHSEYLMTSQMLYRRTISVGTLAESNQ